MINKFKGHFKTVLTHKYYVFKNCVVAGMPLRGILHDLSKFSPIEFFESVKYYQGSRSPIDACKEVNGYSNAWMITKAETNTIMSIGRIILITAESLFRCRLKMRWKWYAIILEQEWPIKRKTLHTKESMNGGKRKFQMELKCIRKQSVLLK